MTDANITTQLNRRGYAKLRESDVFDGYAVLHRSCGTARHSSSFKLVMIESAAGSVTRRDPIPSTMEIGFDFNLELNDGLITHAG